MQGGCSEALGGQQCALVSSAVYLPGGDGERLAAQAEGERPDGGLAVSMQHLAPAMPCPAMPCVPGGYLAMEPNRA